MKQFYAITASGGSYDDKWESVQAVTDDQAKADAYVIKMNNRSSELKEILGAITAWREEWIHNNPAPVCPGPVVKYYPRWGSAVKITDEMREERKQIQAENEAARIAAVQPYLDWGQLQLESWRAWQRAMYTADVLKDLATNLHDTYWCVEPVGWLE